jgi:hypothetical protein
MAGCNDPSLTFLDSAGCDLIRRRRPTPGAPAISMLAGEGRLVLR